MKISMIGVMPSNGRFAEVRRRINRFIDRNGLDATGQFVRIDPSDKGSGIKLNLEITNVSCVLDNLRDYLRLRPLFHQVEYSEAQMAALKRQLTEGVTLLKRLEQSRTHG